MTENKNIMQEISVKKVTLNIGAGKDQARLEKGIKLLEKISGMKPKKTATGKRIPGWGLRPGLTVGCKVTVRGKQAEELLKRFIEAKEYFIPEDKFDENGNISFGFSEYIDIEGIDYEPDIGVIGFNIAVTLERPGFRIKRRFNKRSGMGKSHLITKKDAVDFIKRKFGVKTEEVGE